MTPHSLLLSADDLADIEREFGPLTHVMREALQLMAWMARENGSDPREACFRVAGRLRSAQDEEDQVALSRADESRAAAADAVAQRSKKRRTGGTKPERNHAAAISDRIARRANSDRAVLDPRKRLGIPAEGLSKSDALAVLRSPHLRFMSAQELSIHGIPLVGYRGTIAPPTVVRATPEFMIDFPNERGQRETVRGVRPGSWIEQLRREAETLSMRPPFNALWMAQAGGRAASVWLLLTGRALPIVPVDAVWDPPGLSVDMITVTALARVTSPDTVAREYAKAQSVVLGKRKGRAFEPRSIEVVGFVEREAGMKAGALTSERWADLWRKWNRKRPQRYAPKQSPLPRSRTEKRSRPARFRTPREMREAYLRARASFFPDEPR